VSALVKRLAGFSPGADGKTWHTSFAAQPKNRMKRCSLGRSDAQQIGPALGTLRHRRLDLVPAGVDDEQHEADVGNGNGLAEVGGDALVRADSGAFPACARRNYAVGVFRKQPVPGEVKDANVILSPDLQKPRMASSSLPALPTISSRQISTSYPEASSAVRNEFDVMAHRRQRRKIPRRNRRPDQQCFAVAHGAKPDQPKGSLICKLTSYFECHLTLSCHRMSNGCGMCKWPAPDRALACRPPWRHYAACRRGRGSLSRQGAGAPR